MSKENNAGFDKNIEQGAVKPVRVLIVDDRPHTLETIKIIGGRIKVPLTITNCELFCAGLDELMTSNRGFDLAVLDKSGGMGDISDDGRYSKISTKYGLEPNNNFPLVDLIYRLVQKNQDCKVLINSISSWKVRDDLLPETIKNVTFGDKSFDTTEYWLAQNCGKIEKLGEIRKHY
jgi:hypothetical protein